MWLEQTTKRVDSYHAYICARPPPKCPQFQAQSLLIFFPLCFIFFSVLLSSLLVLSLVVPVGNQRRESMPGWQL